MKKVCMITGTRAEYGLLKILIKRVSEDIDLKLQLLLRYLIYELCRV